MGLEPITSDLQLKALPLSYALNLIISLFCKKLILILTVCWKSAENSNAVKIRGDSF